MAAYIRGNLAVKEAEKPSVPETRSVPKTRTVRRTLKLTTGEKLLYLVCGIGLIFLLSSLVMLSSQIYAVNKQISDTKKMIKVADEEHSALKLKVENTLNPEKMRETAEAQGMKPFSGKGSAGTQTDRAAVNGKRTQALARP